LDGRGTDLMKRLTDEVIQFFRNQSFTIVSTLDKNGSLHNACKGIVKMNKNGTVYLLDLYKGKTYENLKRNSQISLTAVDEHRFKGYCLKGKAKLIATDKLKPQIIKAWENKITSRITQRIIKNITQEKSHPRHPEALMPKPEYMIAMEVYEIVDLTPQHLK
jgi:general stress protein 26